MDDYDNEHAKSATFNVLESASEEDYNTSSAKTARSGPIAARPCLWASVTRALDADALLLAFGGPRPVPDGSESVELPEGVEVEPVGLLPLYVPLVEVLLCSTSLKLAHAMRVLLA
jgi:hypothetical protein